MHDVETAISNAELTVSSIPEDHLNRVARLIILGIWLLNQYKQTGNIYDLEAGLAVSSISRNH